MIDASFAVMLRDFFSNSDDMYALSMPGGSTGGGGGGASSDNVVNPRYLSSGSVGQPSTASLHSLLVATTPTGGYGIAGSIPWGAGPSYFGGGGEGAGGNGGVVLIAAKNFSIANSARIKINGGNGGAGGDGGGNPATNTGGPGGGGAGGSAGIIVILSTTPSSSAGFGLALVEANGGAGGPGGYYNHLCPEVPKAGQPGVTTVPRGVFYIVI